MKKWIIICILAGWVQGAVAGRVYFQADPANDIAFLVTVCDETGSDIDTAWQEFTLTLSSRQQSAIQSALDAGKSVEIRYKVRKQFAAFGSARTLISGSVQVYNGSTLIDSHSYTRRNRIYLSSMDFRHSFTIPITGSIDLSQPFTIVFNGAVEVSCPGTAGAEGTATTYVLGGCNLTY